jgi:hypothetical protein
MIIRIKDMRTRAINIHVIGNADVQSLLTGELMQIEQQLTDELKVLFQTADSGLSPTGIP